MNNKKEDRSGWVAVESDVQQAGQQIRPAKPAYQYYVSATYKDRKRQLLSSGLNASTGDVTKAISERWHTLDDEGKERYEQQAFDDRVRFENESADRDREVTNQQAAAREERNTLVLAEGARRSAAAGNVYDSANFESPKIVHRVVNEDEKLRKAEKQKEKAEKEKRINQQKESLRKARSAQAKKRLEYLLKQSDIFKHFGNVKEDGAKKSRVNANEGAEIAEITRHRHVSDTADGLDDEGIVEASDAVFLSAQPTTLGFGEMRKYQVEGLNWMIGLQENGVNGILADEMGLGKTLQSISVLVYMKEYQDITGLHLIIVPKSTLSNWMNEIARWAPTLRGIRFHGSKNEQLLLKVL